MAKRKRDNIENDGMKLRSGKILQTYVDKLPENIEALLQEYLQNFEKLFVGNTQHAKELLNIISQSGSASDFRCMSDKIKEIYDVNDVEGINQLRGAAGVLLKIVISNSKYYKKIKKMIKEFALNINDNGCSDNEDNECSVISLHNEDSVDLTGNMEE